ncbi:MAG: 50S ribosomal protein L18 [Candidatus Omnitrophica bacterium]|nr:50S ribosomal protein L18 [Candidatus Omnitrophota bacterium]
MMDRAANRRHRHQRIRKRLAGFPERPRLSVFRSHKHLVAQLVNDFEGKTLMGCSTRAGAFRKETRSGGTIEAAQRLGQAVAAEALKHGIKRVVFDRGGYQYHGRVKAFAESARQAGLEF